MITLDQFEPKTGSWECPGKRQCFDVTVQTFLFKKTSIQPGIAIGVTMLAHKNPNFDKFFKIGALMALI